MKLINKLTSKNFVFFLHISKLNRTFDSVEGTPSWTCIEKNFAFFLHISKLNRTFAPAFALFLYAARVIKGCLSYGVMVAQQVLVLFVVVRIRVRQHLHPQSPFPLLTPPLRLEGVRGR